MKLSNRTWYFQNNKLNDLKQCPTQSSNQVQTTARAVFFIFRISRSRLRIVDVHQPLHENHVSNTKLNPDSLFFFRL